MTYYKSLFGQLGLLCGLFWVWILKLGRKTWNFMGLVMNAVSLPRQAQLGMNAVNVTSRKVQKKASLALYHKIKKKFTTFLYPSPSSDPFLGCSPYLHLNSIIPTSQNKPKGSTVLHPKQQRLNVNIFSNNGTLILIIFFFLGFALGLNNLSSWVLAKNLCICWL